MKIVKFKPVELSSLENAEYLINVERGAVKILCRNLTRFNAEVSATYLSSFKHVPIRFNKHLDTVKRLHGKEAYLRDLKTRITHDFAGISAADALVKRIETLRKYARKNLSKSMSCMADCCTKFQPEYYSVTLDFVDRLLASLIKKGIIQKASKRRQLARSITLKKNRYFGERQASQFVSYYTVRTLKDGKQTTQILAVSCLVDAFGRFKMGLTIMPTVLVPGAFKAAITLRDHVSCKHLIPKLLGLSNEKE